jgi:hypothetical protein
MKGHMMQQAPKTDFALDVICRHIALEIIEEAPLDLSKQIQIAYERAHDHEFATYDFLALAVCSACDVGNGVNLARIFNRGCPAFEVSARDVFDMARLTVNLEIRHRILEILDLTYLRLVKE